MSQRANAAISKADALTLFKENSEAAAQFFIEAHPVAHSFHHLRNMKAAFK